MKVCQIGQTRTYPATDQQTVDKKIKAFIRVRGCDIDQGQLPQTCKAPSTSSNDHERQHNQNVANESDTTSELETGAKKVVDGFAVDTSTGSPPCKKQALDCQTDTLSQSSAVFQPREHAIEVRNCSQLSKSLKESLVDTVVQALLVKSDTTESEDNSLINTKNKETVSSRLSENEQNLTSTGKSLGNWRKGRTILLADIAKLFDREMLKKLKNECGGIQTLLRNHRYIFKGN